ncbi:MAG: hypothetical protein V4547_17835 [Bacteroidota bacterium]
MEELYKNTSSFKALPDIKSSDEKWIKWSDTVMNEFGRDLGARIFLAGWNKRGSQAANTYAFRKHIKDKYNIEVDESVWNKVTDLGGGIAEGIGKAFRVGKVVLYVAGGVIVVAVVATIYNAVKSGTSPLKMIKK